MRTTNETTVTLSCPACGARVAEGERFCETCGHDLHEPAPVAGARSGQSAPESNGRPAGRTLAAGSAVAGLVAGGSPAAATSVRAPDAGVSAAPPEACASCGGVAFTDTFCDNCGSRRPAAADHSEIDFTVIAGVSDIGKRHQHNEDAMGILVYPSAGSGISAGVVCDGVSSSNRPDLASTAAVAATIRAFGSALAGVAESVMAGIPPGASADDSGDGAAVSDGAVVDGAVVDGAAQDGAVVDGAVVDSAVVDGAAQAAAEAAMRAGVKAAQAAAALAAGHDRSPNPPSTTFVAAILTRHTVTIGWVGDSRAYWLPDVAPEPPAADTAGVSSTEVSSTAVSSTGVSTPEVSTAEVRTVDAGAPGLSASADPAACLTVDDTLAGQLAAAGVMIRSEAPNAGALIRWLGADATDTVPHVITIAPSRPGRVIVCSDGLYRYLPEPADLAAATPAGTPHEVASALVTLALDGGGHDNVSVIVMPFPPPTHGPRQPEADSVPH